MLRPDIIEFHEQGEVRTDKYNDWFDKIQKTIPSFVRKPLPKHWDGDEKGCGFWFGLAVLDDRGGKLFFVLKISVVTTSLYVIGELVGRPSKSLCRLSSLYLSGIYIGTDVIVTEGVVKNKEQNLTIVFHRSSTKKVYEIVAAMATSHLKTFRQFRRDFDGNNDIAFDSMYKECSTYTHGANISGDECLVVKDGLHPVDFFKDQSESGAFFRVLLYGTSKLIDGEPVLPGFIPKIVHYVWFGAKEMSFMMYLSMLSTLFILNPQKVYIHGDDGLYGKYVDRIKLDDRVIFVNREKPYYIYGHDVLYIQHRSDILRADCLLKYGGIYMDWDVLWLRDPTYLISKGHDAVANFDHMERTGFPDTINLGVLMAKPKSVFMKRWQDALLNYKSKDFLYNAVELPYKIYEEFPQYLHIEKRLQVMCFHLKCHPTFHPRFKSYMEEQPFNWRDDVYSIHYTHPDPPEFDSLESLMNGTGRAA